MSNTTEPTADELAELVQYLPMLRRLAAYEIWAEGSIPSLMTRESSLVLAAGLILSGDERNADAGDDPHSVPPEFRRPVKEAIPSGALDILRNGRMWGDDPATVAQHLENAAS